MSLSTSLSLFSFFFFLLPPAPALTPRAEGPLKPNNYTQNTYTNENVQLASVMLQSVSEDDRVLEPR